MAISLKAVLIFFMIAAVQAVQKPIDVWLDIDPANGAGEVDDGFMLIQAFHSPEVIVRGVSVVFGNAPLRFAKNIGYNMVKSFGPPDLPFFVGAESAAQLGQDNEAVRGMAAALRERPLVILAVGPVTNVGSLLKLHPDLHQHIKAIIVVAGRRPGQRFVTDPNSKTSGPSDFNFESDVPAMQIILDSAIPFVMAPWEVSSKVWLDREDIKSLEKASAEGTFIYQTTQHRLDQFERRTGRAAFNPYDTLALGYLTHPHLIEASRVHVTIEQGPDVRATPEQRAAGRQISYLHMYASEAPKRVALYLHTPKAEFKELLVKRLAKRDFPSDLPLASFEQLIKP